MTNLITYVEFNYRRIMNTLGVVLTSAFALWSHVAAAQMVTATLPVPSPRVVAINPVTNKIYVAEVAPVV